MEYTQKLDDRDVLALYKYLCEYEDCLKEEYGRFNIYDENINKFKNKNELFLGSVNLKNDKETAHKKKNYLLWKEGSLKRKKANVDRAHALLRRIRNAFAHGALVDNQNGSFQIKDEDNGIITLDGLISYPLLYQLIEELKKTKKQ